MNQAPPVLNVGQEVMDTLTFHGYQSVSELTAPSDGTLVARVNWERSRGVLNDGSRTGGWSPHAFAAWSSRPEKSSLDATDENRNTMGSEE